MSRRMAVMLGAVVVLLPASLAWAQTRNFVAYLDGKQETPPSFSMAVGTGTLTLDEATGDITWSVTANGLSSTDAHIHSGRFGIAGAIVVDLGPGTTSFSGSATLDPDAVAALKNNEMYFDLHTQRFPAGEIRGQIEERAAIEARAGNVGTGAGRLPETVLYVGGNAGHPIYRKLKRSPGITTIDVAKPWSGGPGVYAIWIFPIESTADTLSAAVLNYGTSGVESLGTSVVCLPSNNSVAPGTCPCLGGPYPVGFVAKGIDDADFAAALCLHVAPPDPRAHVSLQLIDLPPGNYVVAGIILDPDTSTIGPRHVSLTNAVCVIVE